MKYKKQCAAYRKKYKLSKVTSEVLKTALEEQGHIWNEHLTKDHIFGNDAGV